MSESSSAGQRRKADDQSSDAGSSLHDTKRPRTDAQTIVIGDITHSNSGLGGADTPGDAGLKFWRQSLCITDATLPDNPIIIVSEEFVRVSGYDLEDIVGRNCRFLQGRNRDKDADPHTRKILREAIEAKQRILVDIQNYRRDGEPFWNRLLIRPLKDEDGVTQFFVGVQTPIPESEVKYVGKVLEEHTKQLRAEDIKAAKEQDAEAYNTIAALRTAVSHDRRAIRDAVNVSSRKEPVWYKVRVRAIPEMTSSGASSNLWLGYTDPGAKSKMEFLGELTDSAAAPTFSSVMPRIGRALAACMQDISQAYSTASDASDE